MGCGPGWLRPLPAEASEIGSAFGVEDDAFLCEQLLLVSSCTDFALGVNNPLPGDRWIWMVITQGRHGLADLLGGHLWPDHQGDLPIGCDSPLGNVPDDFINTLVQWIGHSAYPHTRRTRHHGVPLIIRSLSVIRKKSRWLRSIQAQHLVLRHLIAAASLRHPAVFQFSGSSPLDDSI
jgi:hypothetical protein